MSTILVSISRLEHLKEYSRYNYNYYKIPKEIQNEFPIDNSLNIILEIFLDPLSGVRILH